MSSTKTDRMKMAPIRSINDFILDSKRYQAPPLNDLKHFNTRVTSNLLYYQTNYFVVSAIIFLLFLATGFQKMFLGAFGIAITIAVVLFAFDRVPPLSAFRARYPLAVAGLGALNFLVVYGTFRPILYFALALLVPILIWIIHASVRCRGLKNRISNKVDQISGMIYTHTPMGTILATLGFETRDFEE